MNIFLDFGPEGRVVGAEEFGRGLLKSSWECGGEEERDRKREYMESNKAWDSTHVLHCQIKENKAFAPYVML